MNHLHETQLMKAIRDGYAERKTVAHIAAETGSSPGSIRVIACRIGCSRRGAGQALREETSIADSIEYCPETGIFRWKVSQHGRGKSVGSVAGALSPKGYIRVMVNRKPYYAHRLAWFLMTGAWPTKTIDHRNLDRSDNRWENLREATQSQQIANTGRRRKNLPKGVFITKDWKIVATIGCEGKTHYLGRFSTVEAAHAAYCQKAVELFGEFARAS